MSTGTTIRLPHLEAYPVHISLFQDVKNAGYLRQQLLAGNTEFEYAFLDAATVISMNHVLAAVFRAINDMLQSRLKSRNVHSEIVFSLSPNNNIAESFRRFGITDTTTTLLAIKVLNSADSASNQPEPSTHLSTSVEGTRRDFSDAALGETTDLTRVRKIYKLNAPSNSGVGKKSKSGKNDGNTETLTRTNGVHDEVDEVKQMEAVILGIMALKGS